MDKFYIISEIQRVAEQNGGASPGVQAFRKATGINETDWRGKLWVRWGDALREAGFEPNKLQAAYAEDLKIGRFIDLMRELGHFPVNAELRLKSRKDPDFPSHNTFGSKGANIARIRKYCAGRPEFDDIVAMCPAAPHSDRPKTEADTSRAQNFGYVYLLRSGRNYKIGRSNAAGRREYELKIQLPDRAAIVHEIRTDDPAGIEAYWHKRFEAKRLNGEWFKLDPSDVGAFRRRKFM